MSTETAARARLDADRIRRDFPILDTLVNGRPVVYLDNAATSQKPRYLLETLDRFWEEANANVHRGVHHLSMKSTRLFDEAREIVRIFINAKSQREIIFTKGCTEAINLVATCLSSQNSPISTKSDLRTPHLKEGDEVLVSTMEHHSNIVPWQLAAQRVGATVKPIPITDSGEIDLDAYSALLKSGKVKVVGIVHVSNSLGTINPVKEIVRLAHEVGALVVVDGAQAGPHLAVDVQDLDADFYTLSCHKIYAPTGIGVLYGKEHLLEQMPPYHGGGDMIHTVSFEKTTFADLPAKYEAGTPNVAGVVGLAASINYVASLCPFEFELRSRIEAAMAMIHEHEVELTRYATERLLSTGGVNIYGTAADKAGIVSFTMDAAHPHDVGTILDSEGVAIRAGHHCCMPMMKRFGIPATARASFAFYNTCEEVDRLVKGVETVKEMFS